MNYIETMKVTVIEILHTDNTTSKFSGTKKQINDYLQYLHEIDDILECAVIGTKNVEIW